MKKINKLKTLVIAGIALLLGVKTTVAQSYEIEKSVPMDEKRDAAEPSSR